MNITLRWYGRGNDAVTLEHVRQIPGVKGIVLALYQKPAGEVWERKDIEAEVRSQLHSILWVSCRGREKRECS